MKENQNESGMVLIITLWMIVILSTVALAYVQQVTLEMKMVGFQRDTAIVDSVANAGLKQALILLREDKLKDKAENIQETIMHFEDQDTFEYDGGNEAWANGHVGNKDLYVDIPFYKQGDRVGYFYVSVEDESSKLPINNGNISLDMIAHLLEISGVDEDNARALAGAVVDWRDPDDQVTDTGGRSSGDMTSEYTHYNSRAGSGQRSRRGREMPEIFMKNAPLDSVDELLLIPGMTPEVVYGTLSDEEIKNRRKMRRTRFQKGEYVGLKNLISVYTQRININTVIPEVMEAVLFPSQGDQAKDLAEEWDKYRNGRDGEPYTEDDQVLKTIDNSDMDDVHITQVRGFPPDFLSKYGNFFFITSDLFVVTCLAEYEGIEKGYRAVVQRSFIPWEQLPQFGFYTNKLEDLEQVHLQVRLFEPLYDAKQEIRQML